MNALQSRLALADISLFQALSPGQLKSISQCMTEKVYAKGEFIYFEGKACNHIYILQSGRIKVIRTSANGREQILEVLNPGDTCACNPGVSTWCCSSTAQAMTDCTIWIIPRQQYVNLVKYNSKMAQTLNQIFASRIQKLSTLVEGVTLDDPRQRLVKFILDLSKENKSIEHARVLDIPFTHEEIAQRLGLVRETVTRHLQQLKRLKLIDLKPHQIVILDRSGLQKLLA